ncbi:MAG: hypothetical protein BMS9Abin02_1021 [Anaerolineae bacterium]|nr:MAG: hypothetical protein BMS9Abin02_1021 [Anaerolineae bacterium]
MTQLRSGRALISFLAFTLAIFLVLFVLFNKNISGRTVDSAGSNEIKIIVDEDALFGVPIADLKRAGLGKDTLNYDELSLSTGGNQVPYIISDDQLIFFGQKSTSRYSSGRAYILQPGISGEQMSEVILPSAEGSQLLSVNRRVRWEENEIYDSLASLPDDLVSSDVEPWFWTTLYSGDEFIHNFELSDIAPGDNSLKMRIYGATSNPDVNNDHDIDVWLNGRSLGIVRWDGQSDKLAELSIPEGVLLPGKNQLVVNNTDSGSGFLDIVHLDWIELDYSAIPVINDKQYRFFSPSGAIDFQNLKKDGFIIDVTDPQNPVRLLPSFGTNQSPNISLLQETEVIVSKKDELRKPLSIYGVRVADIKQSTNQADFIIISGETYKNSLESLKNYREEQGLSTIIVTIEEIYDEFYHGDEGPEAITNFLKFASEEWSDPKPKYLLLVGDATYDYRNYLGSKGSDNVPSIMIPVEYSGETVSDSRMADVDGDLRPDFAVGRWPVNSVNEVEALIERTIAYEKGAASDNVIFTADESSFEFTDLNKDIIEDSELANLTNYNLVYSSAENFTTLWNQGAWLVNYAGHGSLDRWGKEGLFTSSDVESLRGSSPSPIVVQLTCLTGFFSHPKFPSLSETLLLYDNGPVLIIGATSLTLSSRQKPFGTQLVKNLIDPRILRIGDAVLQAKYSLKVENDPALQEISDTFTLFGDPTTLIKRPNAGSSN